MTFLLICKSLKPVVPFVHTTFTPFYHYCSSFSNFPTKNHPQQTSRKVSRFYD